MSTLPETKLYLTAVKFNGYLHFKEHELFKDQFTGFGTIVFRPEIASK